MTTALSVAYLILSISVMVYSYALLRKSTGRIENLRDMLEESEGRELDQRLRSSRLEFENINLRVRLNARPTMRRRLRYLFTGKLA